MSSIWAKDCGAIIDGIHDDSDALQLGLAIADRVYLNEGTYSIEKGIHFGEKWWRPFYGAVLIQGIQVEELLGTPYLEQGIMGGRVTIGPGGGVAFVSRSGG